MKTTLRNKAHLPIAGLALLYHLLLPDGSFEARADSAVPLPTGCVAWWPGNANANDILGSNNGIMTNNATFVPGEVGNAFNFDGTNQFMEVPYNAASPLFNLTTNFTFELWAKPVSGGCLVGRGSCGGAWPSAELYFTGTSNLAIEVWLSYSNGPFYTVFSTTPLVTKGTWHHVALTYDQTEQAVDIYLDGALALVDSYSATIWKPFSPLRIGGEPEDTPDCEWQSFFPGSIDEVSIYNRALSGAEIRAIYRAGNAGKIIYNPPYIYGPTIQAGSIGSNVVLTAYASGQAPLFYRWYFNGTNELIGQTNSTMVRTNLSLAQIGIYSVSVSNAFGVVTNVNTLLITDVGDEDRDGIPNWWEVKYGLNPFDATDAAASPPGDKLTYLQKYLCGLNPLTTDTDGDGLSDYDEIFVYGTNPLLADTDGDGIPDKWEVDHGLNPLVNDAAQIGPAGVSNLQIYQYDLTHTNQLDPRNPFALPGISSYEILNNGQHTNRFYYDHEDRLVGMESSRGISIGYQYDGNGNLLRQSVLSRASETNGLPVLWQFLNGLTNGTAADGPYGDADGDGWNNYQEYLAGSNPNDPTNQPDLLNNPGVNVGSLTFPFIPSNCVVAVGQLDNSGADEIVVGADGNATGTTNSLFILKEGFHGWSVQRLDIGAFGVTSLAIGQPANRPAPAIYAGLRQSGGTGQILELMNVAGVWQTNVLATSTNSAAFVLGVRSNLDLLASYAPSDGIDGGLYSIAYSTNWNSVLVDTNASHRGLGIVTPPQPQLQQLNNSVIRLLEGGIAAGTKQMSDLIPGLVSYWKLDESSGNAMDSFGTNTLQNNNGVIYEPGKIYNAADFGINNSSKSLSKVTNLGIGAGACSISCWVKMNTEITSGTQFPVALYDATTKVENDIQYAYNGGTRRIFLITQLVV